MTVAILRALSGWVVVGWCAQEEKKNWLAQFRAATHHKRLKLNCRAFSIVTAPYIWYVIVRERERRGCAVLDNPTGLAFYNYMNNIVTLPSLAPSAILPFPSS